MTALHVSPCPLFPSEVEDYYCIDCHTSCSALALLVGPHTNHSRVPLSVAAQYFPSAMRRDAHALVGRIELEYIRQRKAHLSSLDDTCRHLEMERSTKITQLQELQREVGFLDKKIATITQERVNALCYWSGQRKNMVNEARLLLRGADTLARAVGLSGEKQYSFCDDGLRDEGCQDHLQAIKKELYEVRRLLLHPLEWLEVEDTEEERISWLSSESPPNKESHLYGMLHVKSLSDTRERYRENSLETLMSENRALLKHALTPKRSTPRPHQAIRPPPNSDILAREEKLDGAANGHNTSDETDEMIKRDRWRSNIRKRERFLREELNRCLESCGSIGHAPGAEGFAGVIVSEETEVNDISGSSCDTFTSQTRG
ncbi:hypothetical protein ERJ75_000060200 [Trypanosoma vivax]|uniref:Uncharacterized protein n=1 Tax=Trypanosoma vivax (strain Y486) TaxID=1055687 RepID=G0TVH2_TRYVY|nr:hypothetical protein TRVL_01500 [Trypanosoma vivax]KAH8620533.1 hypothetical protein ERJ75_000060200 [Trypanosoma vivax]CCC47938.1 conserved hypothetical protein [Trypanosoma vivax Y486]